MSGPAEEKKGGWGLIAMFFGAMVILSAGSAYMDVSVRDGGGLNRTNPSERLGEHDDTGGGEQHGAIVQAVRSA